MTTPLRNSCAFVVLAFLSLSGTTRVAAQDPQRPDPTGEDGRLAATMQLRWTLFENYFQAPIGRPDSVVQAVAVRGEVVLDALPAIGAQTYLEGSATAHDSFDATYGLGAGVRLGPKVLRVDLGGRYDQGLPRLDLGDAFARADVAQVRGEAKLRLGRVLELTGTGRATWQALVFPGGPTDGLTDPRDAWRDFTYAEAEGRVRTRLLGYG